MYCNGRKSEKDMERKLILASGSPRRIELMKRLADAYDVITADIDESPVCGEKPDELVYRLSFLKARKVFEETADCGPRIVIGADTVVALGDQVLGKPADASDARRMLRALSGSCHHVYTGVAILWDDPGAEESIGRERLVEASEVEFYPVTEEEIDRYIASGEPFGKAGAYAIQLMGGLFVRSIRGDYSNIVGFPVSRIYHTMRHRGLIGDFPVEEL